MAQVATVAKLAFQSRKFIRDLRDISTSHGALSQLYNVLQASQTWQRDLQLGLTASITPLLPELLILLHILGIQFNSTRIEEASWTSTLATSSVLLRVLRLLLNITVSANSSIASSSAAAHSSAGTETMRAHIVAEHLQIAQAGMAAGKLLARIAATLQLTAAVPNAAQRALLQNCSLSAGHAALELLACVQPPKNATNGLQHTRKDAAQLVLFAAGILWFEADVGDQHMTSAVVLLAFGASVYNEGEFAVDSLTGAATDLVLAAGEGGAMLQGPLIGTAYQMAAVDTWTTWLLRSATQLQALLHKHGRSHLCHVQDHRLTAAACTQLKRLLSAEHAGNADFTKWQGRVVKTCSSAAMTLATMTGAHCFPNDGRLSGDWNWNAFHETYKSVQTNMLAMVHAGVLHTFPAVARWLLIHSRAVGSARTANDIGSKSALHISEEFISTFISVPNMLGQYLVATILDDPYSPINRPPQQEVSKLCDHLSQAPSMPTISTVHADVYRGVWQLALIVVILNGVNSS